MKSYTDLNQSKKLAEILPIESADMSWVSNGLGKPFARTIQIKGDPEELCACWSLAALLGVLPKNLDIGRPVLATNYRGGYWVVYFDEYMKETNLTSKIYNNPIDACYEMVLKDMNLKYCDYEKLV